MSVFVHKGTATRAPSYSCSTFGIPSWSGLNENEFDDEQLNNLYRFIRTEAEREGWNDCINKRIQKNDVDSPFHRNFLGGKPHQQWTMYYQKGAEAAI